MALYFNSVRFLHLDSQEKVKETIAKACGQWESLSTHGEILEHTAQESPA